MVPYELPIAGAMKQNDDEVKFASDPQPPAQKSVSPSAFSSQNPKTLTYIYLFPT
jgi:hypothetical protein